MWALRIEGRSAEALEEARKLTSLAQPCAVDHVNCEIPGCHRGDPSDPLGNLDASLLSSPLMHELMRSSLHLSRVIKCAACLAAWLRAWLRAWLPGWTADTASCVGVWMTQQVVGGISASLQHGRSLWHYSGTDHSLLLLQKDPRVKVHR